MRYFEIIEQVIGTPMGATGTATPTAAANLSGNTAVLQDPKLQAVQAAELAKQKQEKEDKKKEIQQQIQALQKELSDLNRL